MLRTAVLSLVAGAVLAADWLRLERPSHAFWRAIALLALAIVPALVRPWWGKAAVLGVATLTGAAVAFSLSAHTLWSSPGTFFEQLGTRFAGGVADFYSFRLPIDPGDHARMHMLILFAIFAFTAVLALSIAARSAIAAVVCFVVAAGWPSTLLAGGHELVRGAFILAVALVLLAGLTERARAAVAPATVVTVFAALALSASAAVAKPAIFHWQQWNPYGHGAKPVSVAFVWNSSYTGIRFPKKSTTVLTVAAPRTIGTYWRATALDRFVRDRWVEDPWLETAPERRSLYPRTARNLVNAVVQEVKVDAFRDDHLVAASIPVAYNFAAPASNRGQNVVLARGGLRPGESYLAWSYTARPTPRELLHSPAIYPHVLISRGHDLELAPGVNAPPFGAVGRDRLVRNRLVGGLAPYRALFTQARRVVGTTTSPYVAVVALERWLRATGGFTYSEQPPQLPGVPPLVAFVTQTRMGYCQHFAGAMALMTRLLGIPARVAVGFVSGHWANGNWTITDHDAHMWVEVWFRGYGWLPFDPTPGRGQLAASYSAASPGFNPAAEAKLLADFVHGGAVFSADAIRAQALAEKSGHSTHTGGGAGKGELTRSAPAHHRHSLVLFLLVLAAAAVGAIVGVKVGRRRLRYLVRDPRRVAAACTRELCEFLADQRFDTEGATIRELCERLDERLAVGANPFAEAAECARFGPPGRARDAAVAARRELAALKRRIRRRLGVHNRALGLVSLRSLGVS
jgi:transglutaminase-like putative cysteine protease